MWVFLGDEEGFWSPPKQVKQMEEKSKAESKTGINPTQQITQWGNMINLFLSCMEKFFRAIIWIEGMRVLDKSELIDISEEL